ncbi:hypothetical protein BDR04DRAFT_1111020 [Suillus decipiens]|nr:hypothetical protein BDR04DRAFT_1111020 [Suillus decipiens]
MTRTTGCCYVVPARTCQNVKSSVDELALSFLLAWVSSLYVHADEILFLVQEHAFILVSIHVKLRVDVRRGLYSAYHSFLSLENLQT